MLSHKIFQTLKDFEEALADVEETTITKYIVYKKEQVFGENSKFVKLDRKLKKQRRPQMFVN